MPPPSKKPQVAINLECSIPEKIQAYSINHNLSKILFVFYHQQYKFLQQSKDEKLK